MEPTIALSPKFRKGCLAQDGGTRGANLADTDLEAISQHRRAITPLRLSESRCSNGVRRGMLTVIRPHGLIAFENGEKCEPRAASVGDLGSSSPSKCKRYYDNFVATR